MGLWEPFTASARQAIARAQQIAQMFGSATVEPQHISFALAEADDDVGHLIANAFDRGAMRESLGTVAAEPKEEMRFSAGSKRVIENAFVNARKLNHDYIGSAHVALGILDGEDRPRLADDAELSVLRTELQRVAGSER